MADAWFMEFENSYQLRKSFPVVAAPLTAAVQHFVKYPRHVITVVLQAFVVPSDAVVLVVSAQFGIELCE